MTAQGGLALDPARRSPLDGLTAAEVDERVARGAVNDVPTGPSRTVAQILRANVLTPFNFLLGGLLAVILVVGPLQDALFGVVLVANSLIGILQEVRAKRTLDRLAVLNAPRARVRREGRAEELAVDSVVLDDVLEVGPGDQIVVDGDVLASNGLEVDESLLTGEADAVAKSTGDEVLSGSFVAAGAGRYRATRVGKEAYATALSEEARKFTLVHSELRAGIDRVIRLVSWAMLPTASVLFYSQIRAHPSIEEALRGTVAGVVAMVPEGLVLLMSVAFAVGVVRLSRRQALVQELAAVETLARVDVICLDKTGTITAGDVSVDSIKTLVGEADDAAPLGALAAADPNPNATMLAIGAAFPAPDGWTPARVVPFSSARKWSGATFGDSTWILGAPEVLLPAIGEEQERHSLTRSVEEHAVAGLRVVLLVRSDHPPVGETLPPSIEPRALVFLHDRVRSEAPDTIRYFTEQGVAIKIISGDHPRTVAAVAGRAGVPHADDAVDARELPDDPVALGEAIDGHTVFGRVTPHQKRAMVRALQDRGHVVAMTGDGVNDVLALKDADIGIAMGTGSSASRAVAQLVLMDGSFATMPAAVAEGRRVINNIERVGKLFLTKTVYSMLLALAVGSAGLPFPFLPRHLTLVGSLTIGVPSFFLALAPNTALAHSGFIGRVVRFAVPAGALAAAATFSGYYLGREQPDVSATEGKTAATLVLVSVGLLILQRLARPPTVWKRVLVASMVVGFTAILLVPFARDFFALEIPPPDVALAMIGIVAIAERLLHLGMWLSARRGGDTASDVSAP